MALSYYLFFIRQQPRSFKRIYESGFSLMYRILSSRLIETERERIAERARDAEKNYSLGQVRSGSVHDLMSELND